jgi:type II secretory pathway component GspD/PulD (secretin)
MAQQPSIVLDFADTDVSQVLKAVGMKTGYSIVLSLSARNSVTNTSAPGGATSQTNTNNRQLPITVSVKADSIEEAVRSVASAAGLRYRRLGNTFVVADNMQKALAPYAYRVQFTVGTGAARAAEQIIAALPYSIVTLSSSVTTTVGQTTTESIEDKAEVVPDALVVSEGDNIYMTGIPEDIASAKHILKKFAEMGEATSEVFPLLYADPKIASDLVTSTFPKLRASVMQNGATAIGTGSLILTGYPGDLEAARKLVEQIDTRGGAHGREPISFRVYDIRYSSAPALIDFLKSALPSVECMAGPDTFSPLYPAFNPISSSALGSSSNSSGSSSGGATGTSSTSASGSNSGGTAGYQSIDPAHDPYKPSTRTSQSGDRIKTLVLRGPESLLDTAVNLLSQTDVKPAQVAFEVKVVDTSPQMAEQLGLNYSWTPFTFNEAPPGSPNATPTNTRPLGFGQFSRVPWSFQAILSANESHTDTKILADPNIIVTDNDQASIFVGDTLRVLLTNTTSNSTTNTVQEFPVGIIMLLRPRVNQNGDITLRVHPVVSTITSISTTGLPQTSEREADTNVVTHDGETIVIGGLIQDEDSKTLQDVPILSQLPLVGELFKLHTEQRTRKEVLVFITSHLVKDGDAAPDPFGPKPPDFMQQGGSDRMNTPSKKGK